MFYVGILGGLLAILGTLCGLPFLTGNPVGQEALFLFVGWSVLFPGGLFLAIIAFVCDFAQQMDAGGINKVEE